MFSRLSLPVRLVLLVAGTTLPLIVFTGIITYRHYEERREAAFDRVVEFTRGIRQAVDAEMQGLVSGLTVLANSQALQRGDKEGFRQNAEAFLRQFPERPVIVLGDRDGRQIFNSHSPEGAPLPPRTERPERDRVFRTGRPAFSELFVGSINQHNIVTVSVPVMRGEEVVYDLSFNPPLSMFQRIIEQQRPSDKWTISIFDQNGVNFARVPNPSSTVGQRASPTLYAILFTAPDGRANTVSLEGVALLTAFSRSEFTGWIAASGIAEATLTAPLWRSLALTAAAGGVCLLIGLGFAVQMARQLARAESMQELLVSELNHRVKNSLATVQALAHQTFRNSTDAKSSLRDFDQRLSTMAQTYTLLGEENWKGASLGQIVAAVLKPYLSSGESRVLMSGPEIGLGPRTALLISMALHELATNAAKYGALSRSGGRIDIVWDMVERAGERQVRLTWRETGGPTVAPPTRRGFGSALIERGFAAQVGGQARIAFDPAGVSCTLECPMIDL